MPINSLSCPQMYLSEYVTSRSKDVARESRVAQCRTESAGSVSVTDQGPNTNKCNGRTFITLLNRQQARLREGESPSGDTTAWKGATGVPRNTHRKAWSAQH